MTEPNYKAIVLQLCDEFNCYPDALHAQVMRSYQQSNELAGAVINLTTKNAALQERCAELARAVQVYGTNMTVANWREVLRVNAEVYATLITPEEKHASNNGITQ